ncbi:flocculation-associated PEP-CTERM protein PepA [Massilia sp. SYSU DXS3249]
MKLLKKLACTTAVAMSFAGAANAATILTDWRFNPNGGGFDNAQVIGEYLDVNGNSFIQLTPSGTNSFTFVEHAVFNILQADSNGQQFNDRFEGGNITAMFEGFGNGTFGTGSANGSFTFSGGTIRIFQNPTDGEYGSTEGIYGANLGTEIAMFDVLAGGGGEVDASGSPIANGQVSVFARATSMEPGYFFRSNGQDLSLESILAFAFTNANPIANPNSEATPNLVSEVACQYAGFTGAGCDGTAYANAPGQYFFVSNNGQFKLAEVPEPGSLALFGIAMLGAGFASRKRAAKKA